jgi:rhamnosyl/mannosyltransferase
VFTLPATQRSEAFGIVQLEAMACGKPVVSTELGTGTSYVNRHGVTGLVVPPNDAFALATALNELVKCPAKRQIYGENGLKRVRNRFSVDRMVDATISAYRAVAA